MKVKCIMVNMVIFDLDKVDCFYGDILGLEWLMDYGWFCIYGFYEIMMVQVSFGFEGGFGMLVFDFFIEVDDLEGVLFWFDEVGVLIEYGLVSEFWGVCCFYVCDLFGKLFNILQYE